MRGIAAAAAFVAWSMACTSAASAQESLSALTVFSSARSNGDAAAAADIAQALIDAPIAELGLTPAQGLRLLDEAAASLAEAGRDDEAIIAYTSALSLSESVSDGASLEMIAERLISLADLYARNDRFSEASQALSRARSLFEDALGSDHPNLRFVLLRQRELAADRILFEDLSDDAREALKAERETLDDRITQLEEAVLGSTRSLGGEKNQSTDDKRYEEIIVHYASHRNRVRSADPSQAFGDRRAALSYGALKVTVPFDRPVGSLGDTSLFSFIKGPKENRMILVNSIVDLPNPDAFVESLNKNLTGDKDKTNDVFVFIHGHATSFNDAARRTAQLAVDLDMRNGGVFYSWPAGSLFQYQLSERQITEKHIREFKDFLLLIAKEAKADRVHVFAHSMGNRYLRRALREIALDDGVSPMFGQLVWAAPDVDTSDFMISLSEDFDGASLREFAENMTLYVSRDDRALSLSRVLGGGYERAGSYSTAVTRS